MVGGIKEKYNLAEITARYVGQPHSKFNCIGLIVEFYAAEFSTVLPHRHGGYTLANYLERWRADKTEAEAALRLYVARQGVCVADPWSAEVFDLMVIYSGLEQMMFPAIKLDQKKFMASSFRHGVEVAALGQAYRPILARKVVGHVIG